MPPPRIEKLSSVPPVVEARQSGVRTELESLVTPKEDASPIHWHDRSLDQAQTFTDKNFGAVNLTRDDASYWFKTLPHYDHGARGTASVDSRGWSVQSSRPSPGELKADTERRLKELRTLMGDVKLPVSSTSDSSTWRFVPETASSLDASELRLSLTAGENSRSTNLGDQVLGIKRYINSAGTPAREYLSRVIKNSDITIVGEQHTLDAPNSHRVMATKVLSELPAGSTLAVELPASLKPIFEEFNDHVGSDLCLSSPTGSMLSLQPQLSLLRSAQVNAPELVDMWKSVRDKGVRVVPIDQDYDSNQRQFRTDDDREGKLAERLLALHRQNPSRPVVAWIGNIHAARNQVMGVSLLAERVAAAPEFASQNRKLSTVFSQLSIEEAEYLPLHVLANGVTEAVGIPTVQNGQKTPITELPAIDKGTAERLKSRPTLSDFDHVMIYPSPPLAEIAAYYTKRADATMSASVNNDRLLASTPTTFNWKKHLSSTIPLPSEVTPTPAWTPLSRDMEDALREVNQAMASGDLEAMGLGAIKQTGQRAETVDGVQRRILARLAERESAGKLLEDIKNPEVLRAELGINAEDLKRLGPKEVSKLGDALKGKLMAYGIASDLLSEIISSAFHTLY